jgi:peptidoglycan/LPS O-acetylase OafA/YrhL
MRDRREKVEAIQLARAIAASLVAVFHIAFGFADHIGQGLGVANFGGHAGQASVALFFVVSGYVMIVSTGPIFGEAGGSLRFWLRRAIRILPPYWLATALLVGAYLYLGRPVDGEKLTLSLALIPYWPTGGGQPLPLLWPGWTLFYEMLFYGVFGIGVTAGRKRTVGVVVGSLVLLVLTGMVLEPTAAPLFSATRPVLLIFLGGMGLALLRERGLALPPWIRLAAFCLAPVAFFALPPPAVPLGFTYLAWAGLPALLFATALLGGPLRLRGFALIDRLGNLSYALYLLHVPLAHIFIYFYPKSLGPWLYLAVAVPATYAASWLAFTHVERPMTLWLNRRLTDRVTGDRLLQQTGL